MAKRTHTAGPLKYDPTTGEIVIDDGYCEARVATIDLSNCLDKAQGHGDGKLFAAAPELLDALKLVREFNCKHAPALLHLPLFKSLDAAVFAALAKATAP